MEATAYGTDLVDENEQAPVILVHGDSGTRIIVRGICREQRTDAELYTGPHAPQINDMFTNHYVALWSWLDDERGQELP